MLRQLHDTRPGSIESLVTERGCHRSNGEPTASREIIAASISGSSWPNSGLISSSIAQSRNGRLKPQLASELETFVQREMLHVHKSSPQHCSVFERLPVVSEAFSVFISRFSEYHDFLGLVKSEYDCAASEGHRAFLQLEQLLRDNQRAADFAREMVHSEHLINKAKLKERDEKVQQLTLEVQRLQKDVEGRNVQIDELKKELSTINKALEEHVQKNVLLQDSLRQETLHRSLMVQQGKKLRNELDRAQKMNTYYEQRLKCEGDEGVMATTRSAITSVSSWRESKRTIPPERARGNEPDDADIDSSVIANAERIHRLRVLLRDEHRRRNKTEAALQELIDKVSGTLNEDRPTTPRPDWGTCSKVLPWVPPAQASSDTILASFIEAVNKRVSNESLFKESMTAVMRRWMQEENICEGDLAKEAARGHWFIGRGTGPHVPRYLRYYGRLRNRYLTAEYAQGIIREIWVARVQEAKAVDSTGSLLIKQESKLDAEDYGANPFSEFVLQWLQKKTGSQQSAVELMYNLHDAMLRRTWNAESALTRLVLDGDLSELVLFNQLDMLKDLEQALSAQDRRDSGELKRTRVYNVLLKQFPFKPLNFMLKLRFALLAYVGKGDVIKYRDLFAKAKESDSDFVELLRVQHVQELHSYAMRFDEALRSLALADGSLTLGMLRTILRRFDSEIPASKMDAIFAAGFGVSSATELPSDEAIVQVNTFISRVRGQVLLLPFSPYEETMDFNIDEVASTGGENDLDLSDCEQGDAAPLDSSAYAMFDRDVRGSTPDVEPGINESKN
jgi:hypothetical protein